MSDKILYDQIKAEQSFSTLIKAAISHELRNPLYSLISQMKSMKGYFKRFAKILSELKTQTEISREQIEKLEELDEDIKECGEKMFSST